MSAFETDPYLQPPPRPSTIVRGGAWGALALGVVYVLARAGLSLVGASPVAGAVLLVAELLALVVFGLRARAGWNEPLILADMPDAPVPPTTVVVDAVHAGPDEVRTTLVSCRRLRGIERAVVADPTGSPAIRAVAHRFGADIRTRTATAAAADASAMWVLLIRAGDLPLPDALELLATSCSASDVGVVQLGVEEANPSSFEHDPDGRWSLAPFEHQVLRPSLAATGSTPWYGDVPAMVRPAAIRDARNTDASTVELGLHALSTGYRVTMVPRTLARLRGPRSLSESLRRRFETTSDLRRFAAGRLRGFPASVRWAFRAGLADSLAAVQHVLLVVVAVLALGFGQLPVDGASLPIVGGLALAAYGSRWQALRWLGRGRLAPFGVFRNGLRGIGVDLAFGRASVFALAGARARVLGVMMASLGGAVIVGAVAAWRGWAGRMSPGATAVGLLLTAGFLIASADVVLDVVARRQRRQNHRVRLGRVAACIDDADGQLHDLSLGGCAVVVAGPTAERLDAGALVTVSFRIPDADGAWRDVAAPTSGRQRKGAGGWVCRSSPRSTRRSTPWSSSSRSTGAWSRWGAVASRRSGTSGARRSVFRPSRV